MSAAGSGVPVAVASGRTDVVDVVGEPAAGGASPTSLRDAVAVRTSGPSWRRLLVVAACWAVLVGLLATIVQRGKLADSLVYIAIFGVAAVGYDAIVGIAGQLYLGLNGLMAVGAYSAGLLALHATSAPIAGLAVGAAAGGLVALLTGLIAVRLRDFYLAIFTLAFGIFIEFSLIAWQDVTGGSTGLGPVPGMLGGSIVVPNYRSWILFAGGVLGVALVLGLAISHSRPGRIWRTIARDERLATAFGIRTTAYRFLVLAYGGTLAGTAGFMMARYTQFLSPEAFGMALALQLILMVFLGGRGSVWGAIVGSAVVYGVNRYFTDRGDYGDIVLGGVFIVVLVAMPAGIAGGVTQLTRRIRRAGTVAP